MTDHQLYDISLILRVPQSPTNEQLGNFMVQTSLKSCHNETLYETSKPLLLPYQSVWLKMVLFWKRFIPFYLLWTDESTVVKVSLVKDVYDTKVKSIAEAFLVLTTDKIQIYEAALKVDAQFTYLR